MFLYAEGVVRGFKLGLLTSADYNNLSQCESLDDIKLYLVRKAWSLAKVDMDICRAHCLVAMNCLPRKHRVIYLNNDAMFSPFVADWD